ncbi:hypothetical protein [Hydrogenophaga sp.]|uniref:hypothetical protein n=1 Tax=Hydrogenophaga sp. TaxID=1904254 RepID=UPI0027170914|nr:hypothetical protein [Hydrogenophaga sp.]MDO9438973.1 hypothetical protein [Hydrogenophaga sp.]
MLDVDTDDDIDQQPANAPRIEDIRNGSAVEKKTSLVDRVIEAVASTHGHWEIADALRLANDEARRLVRSLAAKSFDHAADAGEKIQRILTPLHERGTQDAPSVAALTANSLARALARSKVDLGVLRNQMEEMRSTSAYNAQPVLAQLSCMVRAAMWRERVTTLEKTKRLVVGGGLAQTIDVDYIFLSGFDDLCLTAIDLLVDAKGYEKDGVILGTRVRLDDLKRIKELRIMDATGQQPLRETIDAQLRAAQQRIRGNGVLPDSSSS